MLPYYSQTVTSMLIKPPPFPVDHVPVQLSFGSLSDCPRDTGLKTMTISRSDVSHGGHPRPSHVMSDLTYPPPTSLPGPFLFRVSG